MEVTIGKFKLQTGTTHPFKTRDNLEKIWLENDEGEGMQIEESKLSDVIEKYFNENF